MTPLEQMTLEGVPIKKCTVNVTFEGGGGVRAHISGTQAEKVVKAIVAIIQDDTRRW